MGRVRTLLIGYVVILLFACSPIVSVAIASWIASTHGCTLNEGNAHPCIVAGMDAGGLLYSMGVMGWLLIATVPMGLLAIGLWTAGWIVWRMIQKRRESPIPPPRGAGG